jgi:hypothetical protein
MPRTTQNDHSSAPWTASQPPEHGAHIGGFVHLHA